MAVVNLGTETPRHRSDSRRPVAPVPVLVIAVTLAAAAFLVLMSGLLLVVHPGRSALGPQIIGQNQTAKSALYLIAFVIILPAALLAATRIADRVAEVETLASGLVITLAVALIAARLSGGGLLVMLCLVGGWWLVAVFALRCATSSRPLPRVPAPVAVAAGFGVVLCVTHVGGLSVIGVVVGAVVAVAILLGYERLRPVRVRRPVGLAFDLVVVLLLVLAIPDVVIFKASSALPTVYYPPGVIQFQQDWLLGPVNQLLHGGTLLVNSPSSQYGVGLIYFLTGWFHLVPIGYGMFGLLDGILTALFYAAGYCVLRVAGAGRALAAGAVGFAVLVFLYDLPYSVGALPEEGPLRFGLPMAVILAFAVAARWPRRAAAARVAALVVVGIAAVWALEAFAYTLFTYLALVVVESTLRPTGGRRRWLGIQVALALTACVVAQLLLALATLAGSGHLPEWSQYLAYVHGLLLGGREGSTTYGFANWSPGLAMGAVSLASAAAIALVLARARWVVAAERTRLLALTGLTAYLIASFSYIDNRSSTYLLLYVALPVLMIVVLWLGLVPRRAAWGFVLAVGVLMLGAAWPAIGPHFSRSALAHAYPGGGLRAAVRRLADPPPIDPRAPEVERLARRFLPGRPLLLFATTPDLAVEALMRSHQASPLFLGDPSEDVWIPSIWKPRLTRELDQLRPGGRLITDQPSLSLMAAVRGRPPDYPLTHQSIGENAEVVWILHRLDAEFGVRPVYRDGDGLVVAQLVGR